MKMMMKMPTIVMTVAAHVGGSGGWWRGEHRVQLTLVTASLCRSPALTERASPAVLVRPHNRTRTRLGRRRRSDGCAAFAHLSCSDLGIFFFFLSSCQLHVVHLSLSLALSFNASMSPSHKQILFFPSYFRSHHFDLVSLEHVQSDSFFVR